MERLLPAETVDFTSLNKFKGSLNSKDFS